MDHAVNNTWSTVSKMERIGVRTVWDLYQALPTINSQLVKSGEKALSVDTLSAITKIRSRKIGW